MAMEGQFTIDAEQYAQFMEFVAHTKDRNVGKKLTEVGSVKVGARRQALVLRRTKKQWREIASDEDIAAYGEIHKLKNPNSDPKAKTFVTDNEIKAYKVLDPEFNAPPTLEVLDAKVEEMKASGELTKDGDVADEGEGIQDDTGAGTN